MLYVIAMQSIIPEARERYMRQVKLCIAETRKEPGCISYDLHQSISEPNKVVFVERWKDQAAIDAHFAAPHYKEFRAVAVECITSRVVEIIEPKAVTTL